MGRYVSLGEIVSYLHGAVRLALLDRGGMGHFANTPEACWRSFQAALLAAPLFFLIKANAPPEMLAKIGTLHGFFIEALTYAISWLLFPLVMFYVTGAFGRQDRYFAYIGAYNWASLLTAFLFFAAFLMGQIGIVDSATVTNMYYVLNFVMTLYVGIVAWIALEVRAITAAGIVMLDFIISVSILTIANRMMGLV